MFCIFQSRVLIVKFTIIIFLSFYLQLERSILHGPASLDSQDCDFSLITPEFTN